MSASTACSSWVASPMSTTMLSASRSGRRKVASTTNVAPCRRWAGPKTSPVKLWETIRWSRTVMLNKSGPFELSGLVVGDTHAQGGRFTDQPRHFLRQVREPDLAGDQRVEDRVGEQAQRERHPVGVAAAPSPGRGDGADLARPDRQAPRVERLPERQRDRAVAVPAQLDHLALVGQQFERARQPFAGRTGVHDQVTVARGVGGGGEAHPERGRDTGASRVDVDQFYPYTRHP